MLRTTNFMEQLVIHREVQYLRQKFITLLVISSSLLPVVIIGLSFYLETTTGKSFLQENTKSNFGLESALLFALAVGLSIILLFRYSNLTIEVRTDGFYYKYFPFHLKTHNISVDEVDKAYIRSFSPMGEYGGWGIRYGFGKRGKGYVVSGKTGVQFELINGKKVLFTTTEPFIMESAVNKVFGQKKNN